MTRTAPPSAMLTGVTIPEASVMSLIDLARTVPALLWTCDARTNCDYVSPRWIEYTGATPHEHLGLGWLDAIHPEDRARAKALWDTVARVEANESVDVDVRLRRHDGQFRHFRMTLAPLVDGLQLVTRWCGSALDVQDVVDARNEADQLREQLEALVASRTHDLELATAQLQATTTQLSAAQKISRVGSWDLDLQTGKIAWSDELFRVFGVSASMTVPHLEDHAKFFTPTSWTMLREALQRCIETGEAYDINLNTVREDGEIGVVIACGDRSTHTAGGAPQITGTFQEISERESVQREQKEMTDRLKLAAAAANMGVFEYDAVKSTVVWDDTNFRVFGTSRENHSGGYDAWTSTLHPDDLEDAKQIFEKSLREGTPYDTMFRIITPAGKLRYIRAAAAIYRDENGTTVRAVGINWDITERHEIELALRRSEALQRAVLSCAGSAIVATAPNGMIMTFNKAAEELFGYSADEAIGKMTPLQFHEKADVDAIRSEFLSGATNKNDMFEMRTRDGSVEAREWTYNRKDGSKLPGLTTITTIRDDDGNVIGALGVVVDLTARRKQERHLNELNALLEQRSAQAESANRAKSAFVANMSHELRTPLGGITGVAYLLSKTPLTEEQRALVSTIERSSKSLLGMINDILDLSKIEAEQLTLDSSPFAIEATIDEMVGLMAGFALGKDLQLAVEVDPRLPAHVVGDRVRLQQILTNLVGNAVKFTDHGSIHAAAKLVSRTSNQVRVRFSVKDTGCGIPADKLDAVFERFQRAEERGKRQIAGTGLGLAIVKQLVHMMNGEVGVESTYGEGSEFWCEIPFEFTETAEHSLDKAPISVLIVDDHEPQLQAIAANAKRLGWNVLTARSGREALTLVTSMASTVQHIDAIVLDWQMPEMDGLQTLEEINRAFTNSGSKPGVVMVTAHDMDAFRAAARGDLATRVLSKPVTASTLFDAVSRIVNSRAGSRDRLAASLSNAQGVDRLPAVRILVVDDSEVNREVTKKILKLEGAHVETANDGNEAIARVQSFPDRFDLVLMDIQMPEVDGVEASRRIRRIPGNENLAIIAVTADALASEQQRAFAAGMNDFICKPFDPDDLIVCVRRHVERVRGVPVDIATRKARRSGTSNWPEVQGIDSVAAFHRLGGDSGLFQSLLLRLHTEIEDMQRVTSQPLEDCDQGDLLQMVHKLRGMAGNLGADALHREAGRVEVALRGLLDEAPEAIRALLASAAATSTSIAQVVDALQVEASLRPPPPPRFSSVPISSDNASKLRELLEAQHMDAIAMFADLSDSLSDRLGPVAFSEMRAAIDRLDFPHALAILRTPKNDGFIA